MPIELLTLLALALLSVTAAVYDLIWRRIPNWLTTAGLIAGVGIALLDSPSEGGRHLAAAAVMVLLGAPLFARGWLGGGDVKLLMAVGAILGLRQLPEAIALACLAGGVMGLFEAIRLGVLLPLMLDAKDVVTYYATFGKRGRLPHRARGPGLTVPYGLAIGIGAIAAWFR